MAEYVNAIFVNTRLSVINLILFKSFLYYSHLFSNFLLLRKQFFLDKAELCNVILLFFNVARKMSV